MSHTRIVCLHLNTTQAGKRKPFDSAFQHFKFFSGKQPRATGQTTECTVTDSFTVGKIADIIQIMEKRNEKRRCYHQHHLGWI